MDISLVTVWATVVKCQANFSVLLSQSWKLKNFLPFHIRKQLVQALVLSKLYYNCVVYHNLPHYRVKRLQRIQTACASFVVGKIC